MLSLKCFPLCQPEQFLLHEAILTILAGATQALHLHMRITYVPPATDCILSTAPRCLHGKERLVPRVGLVRTVRALAGKA